MAIFRVLANIVTGTDLEKIDLGLAKLEDYMEIFSKYQNQYIEKNLSENVVEIELEKDEWKIIVERMPYQSISGVILITKVGNDRYVAINDIQEATIFKEQNKVFLIGEPYEDINGDYHNDINENIVIMIKDINKKSGSPNIFNFFEPFLKDMPSLSQRIEF